MDIYKGKKAVVIGGTSGMGYAIVEKLAKGGAKVILTGRDEAKLREAEATYGDSVIGIRSDITDMQDIAKLGNEISDKFKTFDYLFLNAGICEIEAFDVVSEASYDRQFAINTKGIFFTVQRLIPYMNDGGSIVSTSSIADKVGMPGGLVYSATKAAIVSMMQVLAAELLPRKIRANSVSVGYANTPSMGIAGFSAKEKQAFREEGNQYTPMGRIATVDEFATAALFLAHDATFITGVNLPFDGGMSLGVFAQQQ